MNNILTPNANSLNSNATFNASQWAAYEAHLSSAYTIAHNLSTSFTGLTLQNITASNDSIIAAATAYNAADSLPADVDATVLAGYKAQREVILNEIQNNTLSIGFLYFDTYSSVQAYHMKPLSRGTVHINSTDPFAQPVIDYGTATDPTDFSVNAALMQKAREIISAASMQTLGAVTESPFEANVTAQDDIISGKSNFPEHESPSCIFSRFYFLVGRLGCPLRSMSAESCNSSCICRLSVG